MHTYTRASVPVYDTRKIYTYHADLLPPKLRSYTPDFDPREYYPGLSSFRDMFFSFGLICLFNVNSPQYRLHCLPPYILRHHRFFISLFFDSIDRELI